MLQKLFERLAAIQHLERATVDSVVQLEWVDPHEPIKSRGQILGVDWSLSHRAADAIGGADHLPARNAGAGQKNRTNRRPVVSPGALIDDGRSTEVGQQCHQRRCQ